MVNNELDIDKQVAREISKVTRSCRALRALYISADTVTSLIDKWTAIVKESGVRVSSENAFLKQLRLLDGSIKKRIATITLANERRSRRQQMQLRNARELEALIMDGSLSSMRNEIATLKASLVNSRDKNYRTPEQLAADREEGMQKYKKMREEQDKEQSELRNQGEVMAALFSNSDSKIVAEHTEGDATIRVIDTGKDKLDTDIDTFMKEL